MALIIFQTKSGSTYEIHTDTKRIRRVAGKNPPSSRQTAGVDGSGVPDADGWQEYRYMLPSSPVDGESLFVCLDDDVHRSRGWMTSPVVDIMELS